MSNEYPTIIEVDDLWHPDQFEELLQPLKDAQPELLLTAFCIPNKLGPVDGLKRDYPWVTFGIHGFEHSTFECRTWTYQMAVDRLLRARELGYDPVFKAPNYTMDDEAGLACLDNEILLVHDRSYCPPATSHKWAYLALDKPARHVRITAHAVDYPGCGDFIGTNTFLAPRHLKQRSNFVTHKDLVNHE